GLDGTAAVGGWAVGGLPRGPPFGLARRVPTGADLVLRCHLHPAGTVARELPTLGLSFAQAPPTRSMIGTPLTPASGATAELAPPPGSKDFALRDEFVLRVDVRAVEVGGHAHYLCTQMQVWVTPPDGERRSIFWIEDWDFAWQNRYQYAEPMRLPVGTKVEVAITYDNSADNPRNPHDPPRHVRFGLQSTDEMGSIT